MGLRIQAWTTCLSAVNNGYRVMDMLKQRMQRGVAIAEKVLSAPKFSFAEIKPSQIPDSPGVYVIKNQGSDETLYVGRTKNLRQRIYNNHLHGPVTNARLKKYLIEDPNEPSVTSTETAKQYLRDCCYVQFIVIDDLLERGQVEGLLSFLLNVRYLYEEH